MRLPVQYINPVILKCGYFSGYALRRQTTYTQRTVYDYEFEYYLRSDGGVVIDGTYIRYAAGDLGIRKPGQVVQGVPPYECYVLCIDFTGNSARSGEYVFGSPREAQDRYDTELLAQLPYRLTPGRRSTMGRLIRRLYENRDLHSELAEFGQKTTLYNFLNEVFHHLAAPSGGKTGSVNRAVETIRTRYAENLSVADIVCESGLSRAHFHALFRSETGLSPGQMLAHYRIENAKTLLALTTLPVAEISMLCGYPDNAYFARAFRKSTGFAPSDFRRLAGTGDTQ